MVQTYFYNLESQVYQLWRKSEVGKMLSAELTKKSSVCGEKSFGILIDLGGSLFKFPGYVLTPFFFLDLSDTKEFIFDYLP